MLPISIDRAQKELPSGIENCKHFQLQKFLENFTKINILLRVSYLFAQQKDNYICLLRKSRINKAANTRSTSLPPPSFYAPLLVAYSISCNFKCLPHSPNRCIYFRFIYPLSHISLIIISIIIILSIALGKYL